MKECPFRVGLLQVPNGMYKSDTQLAASTLQTLAAVIEVMVCCQFLFKMEALGLGSGGTLGCADFWTRLESRQCCSDLCVHESLGPIPYISDSG